MLAGEVSLVGDGGAGCTLGPVNAVSLPALGTVVGLVLADELADVADVTGASGGAVVAEASGAEPLEVAQLIANHGTVSAKATRCRLPASSLRFISGT